MREDTSVGEMNRLIELSVYNVRRTCGEFIYFYYLLFR